MNQAVSRKNTNWFLHTILAAAALLFLVIVTDDFAQRTGIGRGYSELLLAPTAALILIAALAAWRSYRQTAWIRTPLFISLAVLLVQAGLIGARFAPASETVGTVTAYLSSVMLVHALVLTATVVAFRARMERVPRMRFDTPFARLVLIMMLFTFLTLVSGAFVTVSGAAAVCAGFPLCNGWSLPRDPYEWIQIFHRLTVGAAGLLMFTLFFRAWRTQRYQTPTLVLATVAAILFFAQGVIGAVIARGEAAVSAVALHVATGAAVWAVSIVLVVHMGLEDRIPEAEALDACARGSWRARAKDFLTLTKPIIVLLLLATTLTGMIVGAKAFPPLAAMFWTLLGGALAAGGSGAINQYIDREVDARMKRTARRPLAAGRMTPAEGLAFGVGMCLVSFYLLAVFVNLLAALLSVAGMFYYVWLYSIVLKKSTVQNIVIGGGAGAIPPLVGWAAATGSLTLPALLLFVIIFFWTPPHFWALALLRARDYEQGGIPMLPVVKGELETRRQILIYTLELVGITLLAPVVGLAGMVYLFGAILLGVWLAWCAWKLWREYSPKLAFKMYRYSSMYLLFLFILLAVDALL
jgi:protoheme IX farnesyltransferase